MAKYITRVFIFFIVYPFSVHASGAFEGNVFFIRLNIDENRIELGEFDQSLRKEVTEILPVSESFETSVEKVKTYLQSKIPGRINASFLFFIHAMWGSNNSFVKLQAHNFSASYLSDSSGVLDAVFYILWDTRAVTYGVNKKNALCSTPLLNRLLDLLYVAQEGTSYEYSLMCHSMGNKIFFNLMETKSFDHQLFQNIIFAAADVDMHVLQNEKVMHNLSSIAGSCYVLYNKYDGLLMLSSIRNSYNPLGLNPEGIQNEYTNIDFVNCSFLTDNNRFPSAITGHLYYSTSISTKRKIKSILASG